LEVVWTRSLLVIALGTNDAAESHETDVQRQQYRCQLLTWSTASHAAAAAAAPARRLARPSRRRRHSRARQSHDSPRDDRTTLVGGAGQDLARRYIKRGRRSCVSADAADCRQYTRLVAGQQHPISAASVAALRSPLAHQTVGRQCAPRACRQQTDRRARYPHTEDDGRRPAAARAG